MANIEDGNNSARPWQSYHTVYTNAKAGMDGVDKEKVQRVVYEMSKGSKYFENEERKEAFIRQKIDNMRVRSAKLSAADISHYQTVADKRVLELEAMRDLSKIWVHVDMDAFYAAAETLSNPSLKGKPMAVGSMSMISTANYEARKFGVRAAMPGFIARKLCPELLFVPPDFTKYTYYSDLTRKVFQNCDPNFIATSLDEAYLNVTNVCKERGITGEEVAKEIRSSVYEETGLTCSAGVAPNRLLAKVCSDINKPNGQFVLPNDRMAVITFISSLPIRKIGGIGKVTEHILRDALGMSTCEDMLQKGSLISALFSHSTADFFLSVGLGLGGTDTPEVKSRKSISNERTFSAMADELFLFHKLEEIAESLSADMQKEGLCGRTLTVKLKTASFEIRTRAVTLQKYISTSEDILKHASKLLKAELPVSLRLIGIRMSHFNEDRNGTPPDPTQKILTNFFISGDAPSKDMGDQTSLSLGNSDNYFSKHEETDFSIGSHEKCHYNLKGPLDDNHSFELDENNCIFSNNASQMEKLCPTRNTTVVNKIESDNTQDGVPQLSGANNFLSVPFEGSCLEKGKNRAIVPKGEIISSCTQEELVLWVNGYKCSICGVEMPENFVEERQDHYDFHLAEKLQKEEESGNNLGTSTMRQRLVQNQKNRTASSQSKRKKLKSSPKEGKYIPIDLFFVKSGQNF